MYNRGDPAADRIYTTRLTPYRSMTPRAIRRFIIGFCCLNLVLSTPFFIMGAWPVVGFMGLDVLALYIAFKINFRSADAYETVEVTALELVLAKVTARGQREVWRFNPAWVRLEQDIDDEFHGSVVVIDDDYCIQGRALEFWRRFLDHQPRSVPTAFNVAHE